MFKTLIVKTMIGLCVIMLTTYGSVFAVWEYAEGRVGLHMQTALVRLETFEFAPEEILPDEEEIGASHINLVNNLIGKENGLNKPDSYLNEQINKRQNLWWGNKDTLGSMGVDQQKKLEELFAAGSQNLSFLIWFVSDTEYHIFTTEVDLGENGKPNYAIGQEYISPIYRTIAIKTNKVWEAQTSAKGYALSAYYEESNLFGNVTKIPSFDPETWTAGELE